MRTVHIGVSTLQEVKGRVARAFKGEPQGAHISFATPQLMWSRLTSKRWDILQRMVGQGPMSIREVGRRVGRDVKAVHGDVQQLLVSGLLDKTEDGRIEFPYDKIDVRFSVVPNEDAAA
jgi:predicted transcriptional regulator